MPDIYRQDLILWHDARVEMPDPNSGREFFVYNDRVWLLGTISVLVVFGLGSVVSWGKGRDNNERRRTRQQ